MTAANHNPKQQVYLAQVEQLYRQVQNWGQEKFDFACLDHYPISDQTGDYQAKPLAMLRKNAPNGEAVLINFFPLGLTFLKGKGVVEVQGAGSDEELVYLRKDNLVYTERNGQIYPLEEGFTGEDWYWLVTTQTPSQMRRLTPEVFWELVKTGSGLSQEELP